MQDKKNQTGVVVLLDHARLILLTAEVPREEAAHVIRKTRKAHRAIKFFPVKASRAAATIQKINRCGIVNQLLGQSASHLCGL